MSDTLRSIVEGMEHESHCSRYALSGNVLNPPCNCAKSRLEALLAEYEKWLAVNLEHIKAQVQLKEEKPTQPDAQEGFLHKLTKEEVKNCAENFDYEEEP